MSIRYRSDIDGLRAVAVSLVILSHALVPGFEGGYIGVDVFFVISGYLITRIILSDHAQGQFSLAEFYRRRIRRILPALFVMLAVTSAVAFRLLQVPADLQDFGRSVIATVFFYSNLYFWQGTDYFSESAQLVPLLHTWSLAIEEQFYLLFPLLFLAGLSIPRIRWITVALALASLVCSQVLSVLYPVANYYLLPSRAWELMAGVLGAFYVHLRQPAARDGLSTLGLLMIVAAALSFRSTTPVPSVVALLPVVGACLVLVYGSSAGMAGRLLACAPLVFIGQVSYSAYLWHQPIFALWRKTHIDAPGALQIALLIAATFAIAVVSWALVERPFRRSSIPLPRLAFTALACALLLTAGGGLLGKFRDAPFRLSAPMRAMLAEAEWSRHCLLHDDDGQVSLPESKCVTHPQATGGDLIVWGDSLASSLTPGLIARLPDDIRLTQVTHAQCAPVAGVIPDGVPGSDGCMAFDREAMDYILKSPARTVILAGAWVEFFRSPSLIVDGNKVAVEDEGRELMLVRHLQQTVDRLQRAGKSVVLLYPSPYFEENVRDRLVARISAGDGRPTFAIPLSEFRDNTGQASRILDAVTGTALTRVRPEAMFCEAEPAATCAFARDGVPFIADHLHYTRTGAERVATAMLDAIGLQSAK